MSLLAAIAAEEYELAPMMMNPVWYAVIAAVVFIVLGLVTWSFRDVANRHTRNPGAAAHSDHGTDDH